MYQCKPDQSLQGFQPIYQSTLFVSSNSGFQKNIPKISIITPSYNQKQYLEQTITSVLSQAYPRLEYIVIDGNSTDGSIEVIKKYQLFLTYWISEPDRGQAHAINKGLQKATGEIIAYLNSDDCYLPGTLQTVAEVWQQNPSIDLIHGRCRYINQTGEQIGEQYANITQFDEIIDLWDVWWKKRQFVQPEVFWTRQAFEKVGFFREDLHYVMDYDYWCRILQTGGKVQSIDQDLACFRLTPTQKSTASQAVAAELISVVKAILWDRDIAINPRLRAKLQGNWVFDVLWSQTCAESLQSGDVSFLRWLKLIGLSLKYPQLLQSPLFLKRVSHWIQSIIRHL